VSINCKQYLLFCDLEAAICCVWVQFRKETCSGALRDVCHSGEGRVRASNCRAVEQEEV